MNDARSRPVPKAPKAHPRRSPLPFRSPWVDTVLRFMLVLAFVLMVRTMLVHVLLGGVFAIVVMPLERRLAKKLGPRTRGLAPGLVTTLVVLVIVIPSALVVWKAVDAANGLLAGGMPSSLGAMQERVVGWIADIVGAGSGGRAAAEQAVQHGVERLTAAIGQGLGAFARAVPEYITDIFLFVLSLYYFTRDGDRVMAWLRRLSPVPADRTDELFTSIRTTVDGTVLGILVVAVVQGGLALVAMLLFRVPGAFLWGVVAAICSVLPVFGTTPVTIGAAIYLATQHRYGATAGMVAAAVFIGSIDNVIRPFVQSSHDHVHPLVALLAIFGGIAAFGPSGLLIGPVVAAIALWSLERVGSDPDAPTSAAETPPGGDAGS